MRSQTNVRKIELRFSASNLLNKDVFSLSDPFLVCHTVRHGVPHRRIGRTETVQDDLNPSWATTFSFDYDDAVHSASTLVVDIFDRDSRDSHTLCKHDFLGRAFIRLADLIDAPSMRLHIELQPVRPSMLFPPAQKKARSTSSSLTSHDTDDDMALRQEGALSLGSSADAFVLNTSDCSDGAPPPAPPRESESITQLKRATTGSRASKVRGFVSVFAEVISEHPGINVQFRVRSALLRDTSALGSSFAGRKVTQFYEILRERREEALSSWSCVYRSKDGVTVDRNNYVVFDDVSIEERVLTNMDAERKLRIAFYKRHTRSPHSLISYVTTSLSEMSMSRFRNNDVALTMEGQFGDDDGLGNVLVQRVERWVSEPRVERLTEDSQTARDDVHLQLRADHFLNRKYVSSLNDNPTHMRRLRKMPAFITLH